MIVCTNKRIPKRGKEIRDFIKYLNKNYYIPHKIPCSIISNSLVDVDGFKAYGSFYYTIEKVKYGSTRSRKYIEISNNVEHYTRKVRQQTKYVEEFYVYFTLSIIAHEIYHYFQLRDNKYLVENWVNYNAHKILEDYVQQEDCKSVLKSIHPKTFKKFGKISFSTTD